MKIILSPAKKMNIDADTLEYQGSPVFPDQTEIILERMRKRTRSELKEIWMCNDNLVFVAATISCHILFIWE